jgi:hypothetical protein
MVMVGTWYQEVYNNMTNHQITTDKAIVMGVIFHQNRSNKSSKS